MEAARLSPYDLIDIIRRYYPRVDPEDFGPDQDHDEYVEETPEYRALLATVSRGHDRLHEWREFIASEIRPDLPALAVRDNSYPGRACYEVVAFEQDPPEYGHGYVESMLVARLSLLAPVYEIYEHRMRVVMVGPKRETTTYADHHHTHDISDRFQHAADVFARTIEETHGYQRLRPDILEIPILHLAVPGHEIHRTTIADALFGRY